MIRKHSKPRSQGPWRLVLGLLCLALVVLGGTLQVAHTHAAGNLSHTDCSLCATAHVVAQVVADPAPVRAVLVTTEVPQTSARPRKSVLSIFALFTRPPPVHSTLA